MTASDDPPAAEPLFLRSYNVAGFLLGAQDSPSWIGVGIRLVGSVGDPDGPPVERAIIMPIEAAGQLGSHLRQVARRMALDTDPERRFQAWKASGLDPDSDDPDA